MREKTSSLPTQGLLVKEMMDRNVACLLPTDPMWKVIEYYNSSKSNILPVVDKDNHLVGGFPRKRLLRALIDGVSMDLPCKMYMVQNPITINENLEYDEVSLVFRVEKSRVDSVIVLDDKGKVAGTIGMGEYLKASLNVILTSSATLEAMFCVNHEGIIIVDDHGCIIRINPTAERMFGLKAAKVQGQLLSKVLPEIIGLTSSVGGAGKRTSETPHADNMEGRRTVKSLPVLVTAVPIIDKGKQIGMSYAFLDVSEVERIANELAIVKNMQSTIDGIINASSDGVLVSDMDGSVRYVNEKACNLLGIADKKLIGKPIQTVLHTSSLLNNIKADAPIVDTLEISGQKCIVSHMPFRQEGVSENSGVVSTIFLGNSKLTEEMSRKWFDMNQKIEFYRAEFEKRKGASRFDQIVTSNPEFERIKQDAIRISRSSSTVLLTGESGVGKSMFARGIHEASPRANGPFVVVNCVSIPETLFESELFGYAPGAFTGALKAGKSGYFERADKGTIFMDEIGDIPLSIQAKLLQILQDKEFERVGGTKKQSVDVRIIAATNKDLLEAIANRTFREDLYYRLNVIEFNLPPLRERPEDVVLLTQAFIEKYNGILGARVSGISSDAEELLTEYDWRGNIRELENAIEHAVNFVWEGEIHIENLPSQIANHAFSSRLHVASGSGYRNARKDFEREMVLDALRKTNGNKSAAARLLSLSRSAFYDRLIKYGIKE